MQIALLYAMKLSIATPLLVATSLATSVSAHTIFTQLHVNGVAQGHLKGVRVPVRFHSRHQHLLHISLTVNRRTMGMHSAFFISLQSVFDIDMRQTHQRCDVQ